MTSGVRQLIREVKEFGLFSVFKRYYSFYRAEVVDNADPEGMGRLKVKCRTVFRDATPDKWIFPKGAIAGKKSGFYHLPQVGDMIYLMFEEGDSRFPVWEYGWWLQGQGPEEIAPNKFSWVSPNGNRIDLDDENNTVKITTKDGYVVETDTKLFAGNDANNLGNLIDQLFDAFANTKVSTSLGPQPFINLPEYEALRAKFKTILKESTQ